MATAAARRIVRRGSTGGAPALTRVRAASKAGPPVPLPPPSALPPPPPPPCSSCRVKLGRVVTVACAVPTDGEGWTRVLMSISASRTLTPPFPFEQSKVSAVAALSDAAANTEWFYVRAATMPSPQLISP